MKPRRIFQILFCLTFIFGCQEPVRYVVVAVEPGVAEGFAGPAGMMIAAPAHRAANQEGSVFRNMCQNTCEGKSWYEDGCVVCSVLMTNQPMQ